MQARSANGSRSAGPRPRPGLPIPDGRTMLPRSSELVRHSINLATPGDSFMTPYPLPRLSRDTRCKLVEWACTSQPFSLRFPWSSGGICRRGPLYEHPRDEMWSRSRDRRSMASILRAHGNGNSLLGRLPAQIVPHECRRGSPHRR